jgi:hypothetical protein
MLTSDAAAAITPVVAEFVRLGVPYYVGGSVVSSAHGIPRSTIDVDVVADLSQQHVGPLVAALRDRYYIDGKMISEAITRKACFNLIHLATSFKVDVFVLKDREFDRVALSRIQADPLDPENPSTQFFLASAEDIVLSKLEWFRLGDEVSENQWRDVVGVLKVEQRNLDRAYLAKWAADLGVADLLERAWNEAEGKNQ